MMSSAPAAPYTQFSGLQVAQRLRDIAAQIVRSGMVIENNEALQSTAELGFIRAMHLRLRASE